MKKIILYISFIILFLYSLSFTQSIIVDSTTITAVESTINIEEPERNWSLKASCYKIVALDSESVVQSGLGTQVSLYHNNLYLYLSTDLNQLRFAGQDGPDVILWSLGIGVERKIVDHLTLSIDIGWYEPTFKEKGEPQDWDSSPFSEGLLRYLNKFLMPENQGGHPYIPNWEYYSLNYKGGIGGKLNLAFEYSLTQNISFDMTAGYRYLKIYEVIIGADYDGGWDRLGRGGYWAIQQERDFSSFIIGGKLSYKF